MILGVYRHHILSICSWLDDLIFTINSPALAVQKRGVEPSSHMELNVGTDLTSTPEMAQLGTLIKKLHHLPDADMELSFDKQQAENHAPGVLTTVGALAVWFGLSDALLGDRKGKQRKMRLILLWSLMEHLRFDQKRETYPLAPLE